MQIRTPSIYLAAAVAAGFLWRAPLLRAQDSAQAADLSLNVIYQDLMRRLPTSSREQLRKAERAWVTFVDLDCRAIDRSAHLGQSQENAAQARLELTKARIAELGAMVGGANSGYAQSLQQADQELNLVYRQCISLLSSNGVSALREAQRAWISFRDANRPFGTALCATITVHRTDQLKASYLGQTVSRPTAAIQGRPMEQGNPDPTTPDPFAPGR